jgi:excisionase family DNA binding protein
MPDLLTIPEAARALTLSESSVRRLVAAGDLAILRLSRGCIRIEQSAIEQFLARKRGNACRFTGKMVAGWSSFSSAASAFTGDARRRRRARRPASSKPGSVVKFSRSET